MAPPDTSAPGASLLAKAQDFLGLERSVLIITAASAIQSLGVALWIGYLPKMLEELGAPIVMIGAFATFGALVRTIFPQFGGMLSDRLGRARAMVLASALGVCGYLVYLIAPTWWLFLPGAVLVGAGSSFSFMGSLALTGDAVPAERRAVSIAARNVVARLPMVLAPPVGGALILWLGVTRGARVALLATVLLFIVATWLQRRSLHVQSPSEAARAANTPAAWRQMRPELKRVLVGDCLVRFGAGMSGAFVVLYVMNVLEGSALDFGFLTSLQGLVTVTSYVPISKLADRGGTSGRWPFVATTYLMFAAFPLLLALGPNTSWLIAAFVVAGLRELGEPARKALIIDLAEGESRGSTIGAYYTILGAVVFPSAFLGGWLWEQAPTAPFLVGAGITALGLAWFLWQRPVGCLISPHAT